MTLSRIDLQRLEAEMSTLKAQGVPFAMATIVRTVDATSAKPGGKALLDAGGTILMGWVGGGCARGAVGRAAKLAIETGAPQFISLRPQELLETEGVAAGDERDGVTFARNGCPSKGTMDVFVEPVLPMPRLTICGTGLVALALADLGARFDYHVTLHSADPDPAPDGAPVTAGFDIDPADYVVIATQGQGDLAALRGVMAQAPSYVSFVGSLRKFETLADKLTAENAAWARPLSQVHAPAGLHINAITPEEIALSILAQITQTRRKRSPPHD